MDIKELTRLMHSFVESKGWYDADSKRPQTARNIAMSLSIESAEILEHFQWREVGYDREELSGELADVGLYLLQLAAVTGIDLETAIVNKLAKNHQRQWDQE